MLVRLTAAIVVAGLTVWLANKWPSFPRQGFVRWTSEGRENGESPQFAVARHYRWPY